MLPSRRSPLKEIVPFHREFDELFNRMLARGGRGLPSVFEGLGASLPPLDFVKKGENFVVRVELPGIDPKHVDISVFGNRLRIRGERRSDTETRDEDYYVHEIGYGSFERTVTLPEDVKPEEIKASYKDGMLEITMPAREVESGRKIPIATEEGEKKTLNAA